MINLIQNTLILNEILYRPILNLLVLFLELFRGNMGLAIILLTLTVRLLMFKQTSAGNNMQKGMGELQPKLDEIQKKYKNDPQRLSQETMKVFKTHGKAPLKGCLMMLVQIPVFVGLFFVIQSFVLDQVNPNGIYSFFYSFGKDLISRENIKTMFLGMDLLVTKNIILTIIGVIFTYLQMKLTNLVKPATPTMPGANVPDMSKMMGFMGVFMAFMIGTFIYSMPAGVGIYIVTTTVFSVTQYSIQYRSLLKAKFIGWFGKKKNKGGFEIIENK